MTVHQNTTSGRQPITVTPPKGKALFPSNQEFEDLAVGVALQYSEHAEVLIDALTEEDFYHDTARTHFAAMLAIASRGGAIDLASVQLQLGDRCAREYLTTVTNGMPRSLNVDALVRALRDFTKRRHMVRESIRIAEQAILGTEPADAQIEAAGATFDRLADDRPGEQGPEDATTVAARLRAAQDEPLPTGIATGITDLDALLGRRGLRPGELVIAAARTGVGKSVLGIQVGTHVGLRLGQTVLYFTLEMTADEVIERAAIAEARVNADDVRERTLSPEDARKYGAALTKIESAGTVVVDEHPSTVRRVRRYARRLKRQRGVLGLVVVDYLQLLTATPGMRYETRALEVAQYTRALKALAKELRVPILVLCQLNREPERSGSGSRPRLYHLRESGAIEQDADTVLLIHRHVESSEGDHKTGPNSPDWIADDQARIYVAKRRGGQTGQVSVRWSGPHQRFDSLSHWSEAATA